ncbi:hypothetical protein BG07_2399 [Bacillus pseudomycoides]|uniref:hypothetical protein n=1 Tax=Bacillus TaxID=1386 RepID=UPI00036DA244|nr:MULTISPECIES: hypothetical protein [Bacillus]AIK40798.1 hypothetical protein DJ92_2535 [Bacillus pseudomycoides]AJI15850.1 hypothetical protein BG07_2399 [Bacillus pseudomycoides]
MPKQVVHSTDVLTREPQTASVVANIVNLDRNYARYINVEIWDWSNHSNPIQLPILVGEKEKANSPYYLDSEKLVVLYANLDDKISLYEIRITHFDHSNIITNCFGRSSSSSTGQEGDKVYHKQLVRVHQGYIPNQIL